jgi:hypothetical protein
MGRRAPRRVAAIRRSTPLAEAALLLVLIFGAGSASALVRTLELKTGTTFNSGSGIALDTDAGLYGTGTSFPLDLAPLGMGQSSLTLSSFNIPDLEVGAFGEELFAFQLMDSGAPTTTFTLTLDDASGEINASLGDPQLEIEVTREVEGVPMSTESFTIDLTTGTVSVPACGGSSAQMITGMPLDPVTGAVKLIGAACLDTFAGSPFGRVFQMKLEGIIAAQQVPSLSPGGKAALVLVLMAVAMAALRRRLSRA